ncbi:MAG TPA: hypothetical protein VGH66_00550 [Acidimicrobiales bacterium]|jgi:hypothetical protein
MADCPENRAYPELEAARTQDVTVADPILDQQTGRYLIAWIDTDNVKHQTSGRTAADAVAKFETQRRKLADRTLRWQLEGAELVGQLSAYGLDIETDGDVIVISRDSLYCLVDLLDSDSPAVRDWCDGMREARRNRRSWQESASALRAAARAARNA